MTTNTETNAAVSSGPNEKRFRDMLLPALIFYVMVTAMFMILEVTITDEPLADNLPFLPFMITIASFISDTRRDWGWWSVIKVVCCITALAVSAAAIYQLAVDTLDVQMLALYPATAFAVLAVSWLVNAIGRTSPFQFMGRKLARLGVSKWFQRMAALLIIAAGIAITVYAYWLRNF